MSAILKSKTRHHPSRRQVLSGSLALSLAACTRSREERASALVAPMTHSLQNVQAGMFTLKQLAAKTILLEFWATSCAICVAEMPLIVNIDQKFAPQGLCTVALAMPYDRPDRVLHYAKEHELPFIVAIDPAADLINVMSEQAHKAGEIFVEGTPTRLLLDRSGRVRYREEGGLKQRGLTLEAQIQALLAFT
jgi:thiol-disulfide isomerase/thioredoxin